MFYKIICSRKLKRSLFHSTASSVTKSEYVVCSAPVFPNGGFLSSMIFYGN